MTERVPVGCGLDWLTSATTSNCAVSKTLDLQRKNDDEFCYSVGPVRWVARPNHQRCKVDSTGCCPQRERVDDRHLLRHWQAHCQLRQSGDERAASGDALIKRLGDDLSRQFGRGFGWRNLTQMRAFYLSRPAETILQTASA